MRNISLNSPAVWISACDISHSRMEERLRKTLRLVDGSSAAVGAQTDHSWRRALRDHHHRFWAHLFLHVPFVHHFADRQSEAVDTAWGHWRPDCSKPRMSDPDILSMRQQSGGAVELQYRSVDTLPVAYGTDNCGLRQVT